MQVLSESLAGLRIPASELRRLRELCALVRLGFERVVYVPWVGTGVAGAAGAP